jgi:hypothetical protein
MYRGKRFEAPKNTSGRRGSFGHKKTFLRQFGDLFILSLQKLGEGKQAVSPLVTSSTNSKDVSRIASHMYS